MPSFPLFIQLLSLLAFVAPGIVNADTEKLDLYELEKKVIQVIKKSRPSIVALVGTKKGSLGTGTGTIIQEDGLILTAAHVLGKNDEVFVVLPDGSRKKAKTLGCDYERDIALAKIIEEGTWPYIQMGQSDRVQLADILVAMGHAGGFDIRRPAPARIGRAYNSGTSNYIVTDCTLIGGDSGGPLLDLDGKVIGVHSSIGMSLSQNNHVPVQVAVDNWDRLVKGEKFRRLIPDNIKDTVVSAIGVIFNEGQENLTIKEVIEGSPARKAGLKPEDQILRIGFQAIYNKKEYFHVLSKLKPGRKIKIALKRNEEVIILDIELGKRAELFDKSSIQKNHIPNTFEYIHDKNESLEVDKKLLLKELQSYMLHNNADQKFDEEDMRKVLILAGASVSEINKLDPSEIKKLFVRSLRISGLEALGLPGVDSENYKALDLQYDTFLEAYQPIVEKLKDSTLHILGKNDTSLAYATIIDGRGFALTKWSEIKDHLDDISTCEDHASFTGKITVARKWKEHDLALLQLETASSNLNIPAIQWTSDSEPEIGTFLSTPEPHDSKPLYFGLYSVKTRSLSHKGTPFLGISVGESSEGVIAEKIIPETAAEKSILQDGDQILELNDKKILGVSDFINKIASHKPGDEVTFLVRRDKEEFSVEINLGSLPESLVPEDSKRFERMNSMGSSVSKVNDNFPSVFQHDMPLEPDEMGGPVVDIRGNVLGINIARGGRIKSYAIPSTTILELLQEVDFHQLLNTPELSEDPIEDLLSEFDKSLKDTKQSLSDVKDLLIEQID